ncbi:MAG TPA: hypothetical protein VEC57_19745 [Candidatus Limnocylindrales bacterium]|nr:hypothetical protein [Candidatus Limnocylindrales bacterium]
MREHGRLRVLHFGLGAIGIGIARESMKTERLQSVAAVDLNPANIGQTLGALAESDSNVVVRASLEQAVDEAGGIDVAFHCAGSHIADIETDLHALMRAGCNVVTTAEELIYPYAGHGEAALRLDGWAKAAGVTLYAAGVNPGFLMDRLPAYLSSMTLGPRCLKARRMVDLSRRRNALRRKMGVGEPADSVAARCAVFSMGHAGFVESVQYVAAALRWPVGAVEQRLEPVVADRRVERGGEVVEAGHVLGLAHTARAVSPHGHEISLALTMRLDCTDQFDEIEIDGRPPIHVRFPQGLQGDLATLASAVNAAPFVATAAPGLLCQLATPTAL